MTVIIDIPECQTTGPKEKDMINRKAELASDGCQPIYASVLFDCVRIRRTARIHTGSAVGCVQPQIVEVTFHTKHKIVMLEVVADLTATTKTGFVISHSSGFVYSGYTRVI